jgi:uncharacterized protein
MRIDVSDILTQGEGYRTSFEIVNETIELADVSVADKVGGQISLGRTERGLELNGTVNLKLNLECHRCLRSYVFPETLRLHGEFSRFPTPEDEDCWPISKDLHIDLQPAIQQEAILGLPIKQLCTPDCAGLDIETGEPVKNNS